MGCWWSPWLNSLSLGPKSGDSAGEIVLLSSPAFVGSRVYLGPLESRSLVTSADFRSITAHSEAY